MSKKIDVIDVIDYNYDITHAERIKFAKIYNDICENLTMEEIKEFTEMLDRLKDSARDSGYDSGFGAGSDYYRNDD